MSPVFKNTSALVSRRAGLLLVLVVVAVAGYMLFGDQVSLSSLAEKEDRLRQYQESEPLLVYFTAFLIYTAVIAMSLPSAAAMTLVFGWYFGLLRGTILVSGASTAGCLIAFLLSRYLLRSAVNRRFGERLAEFNRALERDGAFYLFSLRLVPLVPLFVINIVMGVTPIRTLTFWWVSQLGMLPGTIVFVYAGSSVPSLKILADEGLSAVISPARLLQLFVAFTLLGLFPLIIRLVLMRLRGGTTTSSENS